MNSDIRKVEIHNKFIQKEPKKQDRIECVTQWVARSRILLLLISTWTTAYTAIHYVNSLFFYHSLRSLRTCPYPFPNRIHHRVRYGASHLNLQYLPIFLRSSSSRLRLLPLIPVTYILPTIITSITVCCTLKLLLSPHYSFIQFFSYKIP